MRGRNWEREAEKRYKVREAERESLMKEAPEYVGRMDRKATEARGQSEGLLSYVGKENIMDKCGQFRWERDPRSLWAPMPTGFPFLCRRVLAGESQR